MTYVHMTGEELSAARKAFGLSGAEFARGLTNYAAADAGKICGLRTDQIGQAIGAIPYEEIIHRDNLVVIL